VSHQTDQSAPQSKLKKVGQKQKQKNQPTTGLGIENFDWFSLTLLFPIPTI